MTLKNDRRFGPKKSGGPHLKMSCESGTSAKTGFLWFSDIPPTRR